MATVTTLGSASRTQPRCSIARSLDVLGERWALLIVREAFWGRTRFSEFRQSLGVASDVLTDRLSTLVEAGVLERRAYREEGARERASYHLTDSGRKLTHVLAALVAWGDEYRPSGFGPATEYRETATGERVRLAFVTESGRVLGDDEVVPRRGAGATPRP